MRFLLPVILGIFALLPTNSAMAQTSGWEEGVAAFKGLLVNITCYAEAGSQLSDTYKQCATKNVKNGQPMGLLTDDGTLYSLAANPKDSKPYDSLGNFEIQDLMLKGKAVTIHGKPKKVKRKKTLIVHGIE